MKKLKRFVYIIIRTDNSVKNRIQEWLQKEKDKWWAGAAYVLLISSKNLIMAIVILSALWVLGSILDKNPKHHQYRTAATANK